MASFNKIVIVGYLGRDPEIRNTPQGTAVCHFTIATTEKRKDRTGEAQDVTTWFRVSAWGRQAEVANQYLSKGKQVYVEGRLRQEEYTDRDGVRRQSLEVNATDIQFLGARSDDASAEDEAQVPDAKDKPKAQSKAGAVEGESDIPF